MAIVYDKEHVEALKQTIGLVGHLYPVLMEKGSNKILSGRHRKSADANWPEQEITVENSLQRELIILLSNRHRQVKEEEVEIRLNRIAAATAETLQIPDEDVCAEMVKRLSPAIYSQRRIEELLESRWKAKTVPKKVAVSTTSPLQALENDVDEIKEISTLLDARAFSDEDPRPFTDCDCSQCPHFKKECY
jgi:hypothetical protein